MILDHAGLGGPDLKAQVAAAVRMAPPSGDVEHVDVLSSVTQRPTPACVVVAHDPQHRRALQVGGVR